jgi:hypothetical protein
MTSTIPELLDTLSWPSPWILHSCILGIIFNAEIAGFDGYLPWYVSPKTKSNGKYKSSLCPPSSQTHLHFHI